MILVANSAQMIAEMISKQLSGVLHRKLYLCNQNCLHQIKLIMPTRTGKDSKGCFARWGSQKKYYFKCSDTAARKRAIAKANTQARAIRASGYRG